MDDLCSRFRRGGESHNIALGNEEKEVLLEVRPDLGGSTLFEEIGGRTGLGTCRVQMKRFDQLMNQRDWGRPCLCKIDVQGSELKVLQGMGTRIRDMDMVIVETFLIATLQGAPELFDVLSHLHNHHFALLDVLCLHRRPLDGLYACADLVFVNENHALRADKRWQV